MHVDVLASGVTPDDGIVVGLPDNAIPVGVERKAETIYINKYRVTYLEPL